LPSVEATLSETSSSAGNLYLQCNMAVA
jgi:hypothetical protein